MRVKVKTIILLAMCLVIIGGGFWHREKYGISQNEIEESTIKENDAVVDSSAELNIEFTEMETAKVCEFLYRNMSFLNVDQNPDNSIPEKLEKVLGDNLLAGTLVDFLASNSSRYLILSESEIEECIQQDNSGVLWSFQQTEGTGEDEWIRFERDGDIVIRQKSDNSEYMYYKFPKQNDSNEYGWGLYAFGSSEEYYFLNWENEDYLITIRKDNENKIKGIATYCMFTDSIYGWLLYQEIVDTDIFRQYITYVQNGNDFVGSSIPSYY